MFFEAVYPGVDLPVRKTSGSAGYDFEVSKETVIYPYFDNLLDMSSSVTNGNVCTLEEVANQTKALRVRPVLVPTGVKCCLDKDTYLELSVRSSTPLKHWLILANGIGIIDSDYYNNPDNDGEIFFQLINLSPYPIKLLKGDIIGQGIIKKYLTVENDDASGNRTGGFGSTSGGVK